MAQKRKWSELSSSQKAGVVVVGAIEVVLTALAMKDLASRPAVQVRGPKWLWSLVCLVQPVGPIAYLALGRRGDQED